MGINAALDWTLIWASCNGGGSRNGSELDRWAMKAGCGGMCTLDMW